MYRERAMNGRVLKVARSRRELESEAEALQAFGRHRAVAVREVRTDDNHLVLERVHPGASLASLATEDEALRIVVRLLAPRWPPVPAGSIAEPLVTFARALDTEHRTLRRASG